MGWQARSSLDAFFADGGDYVGLQTAGAGFAIDAEYQAYSGNAISIKMMTLVQTARGDLSESRLQTPFAAGSKCRA